MAFASTRFSFFQLNLLLFVAFSLLLQIFLHSSALLSFTYECSSFPQHMPPLYPLIDLLQHLSERLHFELLAGLYVLASCWWCLKPVPSFPLSAWLLAFFQLFLTLQPASTVSACPSRAWLPILFLSFSKFSWSYNSLLSQPLCPYSHSHV